MAAAELPVGRCEGGLEPLFLHGTGQRCICLEAIHRAESFYFAVVLSHPPPPLMCVCVQELNAAVHIEYIRAMLHLQVQIIMHVIAIAHANLI